MLRVLMLRPKLVPFGTPHLISGVAGWRQRASHARGRGVGDWGRERLRGHEHAHGDGDGQGRLAPILTTPRVAKVVEMQEIGEMRAETGRSAQAAMPAP